MKKLFMALSLLCTALFAQQLPAQEGGADGCCAPAERPVGPCNCLYVRYTPQYYTTYKTVCEPQCYTVQCSRWVPRYYDKCCVRYVPQYYTVKQCKYERECYNVQKTRNCYRQEPVQNCRYIPCYFWKQTNINQCGPCGAGAEGFQGGASEGFQGGAPEGFQGGAQGGCCPTGGCGING